MIFYLLNVSSITISEESNIHINYKNNNTKKVFLPNENKMIYFVAFESKLYYHVGSNFV